MLKEVVEYEQKGDIMCPYSRQCAMLMAGFIFTEILTCRFGKETCPYAKNKEPDEPVKNIYYSYPAGDAVVVASGSPVFIRSNLGQYISDLPDGKKLYFVRPKEINIIGGTFRVVNSEGKESIINFEIPEE